jgi:hypothetical protein
MTAPKRIKLSRAKGWRMPENAVKVDRSTRWGNPFVVGKDGAVASCVARFRKLLWDGEVPLDRCADVLELQDRRTYILRHIDQLRGHDLACWCPLDQPCHADVLLELANAHHLPEGDDRR